MINEPELLVLYDRELIQYRRARMATDVEVLLKCLNPTTQLFYYTRAQCRNYLRAEFILFTVEPLYYGPPN